MPETTRPTGAAKPRPLSPHLSIYKPIPTMMMSIAHRITGGALYVGTLLVAWWLLAAAAGPEAFATADGFMTSIFGKLILFGFTFALVHHMLGGIKHLVQDTGEGLDRDFTTRLAKMHPVASIVLTFLIWLLAAAF